jgi:hypothetical protein
MARTNLTVTVVNDDGVVLPAAVAGTVDGHMFANDGRTILQLTNGGVAPRTITLVTPGTVEGLAIADKTVVVANGQTLYVGRLERSLYNQPQGATDEGKVYLNFPAGNEGDVTVRALRA